MNTICILLVVALFFLGLAFNEERKDRIQYEREMLRYREMWDRATWKKKHENPNDQPAEAPHREKYMTLRQDEAIYEACNLSALKDHIEAYQLDHPGADPKVVIKVGGRMVACRAGLFPLRDGVVELEVLED